MIAGMEKPELLESCRKALRDLVMSLPALPVGTPLPPGGPIAFIPQPQMTTTSTLGGTEAGLKQSMESLDIALGGQSASGSGGHGTTFLDRGGRSGDSQSSGDWGDHGSDDPLESDEDSAPGGGSPHLTGAAAIDAAKKRGNASFASGDFMKAISHYTMGIRLVGGAIPPPALAHTAAVLYSNRSAAFSSVRYWGKALDDAERAIALDPG